MKTRVNCFLDQNDVVNDMPSLNKSSLVLRDYRRVNLFDPIGNYFGNDFVPNVAKQNRYGSVKGSGPFLFRNQRKKG